jgi:hypothetical protein
MRAAAWLVVSVLSGIACGAAPVALPVTPSAVTPPPAPPVVPVPFYHLGLFVLTMTTPCSGCLVEIISGPGSGASATTVQGHVTLRIPEPGGAVTIRASRDKYRPATSTMLVDGLNPIVSGRVSLEPAAPTVDVAGARLLEVRAGETCSNLPTELRLRTYPVSFVKQDPNIFQAEPIGGVFSKNFHVRVLGLVDEAVVGIGDFFEVGIVEQLPDGGRLEIHLWPSIVPVVDPDAISATIEGTVLYHHPSPIRWVLCESKAHSFTLTRR